MDDATDADAEAGDGDAPEAGGAPEAGDGTTPAEPVSPARFLLSMAVSVGLTLALVGAMAWGAWTLLPSPFGLAVAAILLGGALLGNGLVVRKNYARWRGAGGRG